MARFPGAWLFALLLIEACAAPQTQLGSVSQDQIIIEQARQQQFALETSLKQTFRVLNVANPLLKAAVPLCGDRVQPVSGYSAGNAYLWQKDELNAALALGYNDTLAIMNVTPGLPGDKAGLKAGDRILAINGLPIIVGPRALNDLQSKLPDAKDRSPKAYSLTYRRGSETETVTVMQEMSCAFTPQLVRLDDVAAWADGHSITITTGMLRFVADDDELAVVVGHELGHDAMRHMDAMSKNTIFGALLGAIVDVAAATQGVNTQGEYTKQGAQIGSMVFSQDFEREADYVGLYILALANRSIENAPTIWRRMAAANPKTIKFASSHPTTAERFVRLATWRDEIDRKIALGLPLRPDMKNGKALPASSFGAVPTQVALTPSSNQAPTSKNVTSRELLANKESALSPQSVVPAQAEKAKEGTQVTLPRAVVVPAAIASTPTKDSRSGVAASAVIGAPTSESDRLAAIDAFAEANAYMGNHQWKKAEDTFRKALLLDGSAAKYHAGLGSVLMILEKWKDAEAEYTAAVLLDLDNANYRRLVKEARAKSSRSER